MRKREFMFAGAGAVTAGASWPQWAGAQQAAGAAANRLVGDATLNAWQSRVGQRFEGREGESAVLERVDARGACDATSQFTLIFVVVQGEAASGSRLWRGEDGLRHALHLDLAGQHRETGHALLRADFAQLV